MLAYILALAVGLGSLGIYMAAFFFPEVHRKNDFIWSGVGLFYALVLWVCAGRITGGVLLGQIASVSLLGWFCWQTLTLRRELMPAAQQTAIPSKEKLQEQLSNLTPPGGISQIQGQLTSFFNNAKDRIQATLGAVTKKKSEPVAQNTQQPPSSKTPSPSIAGTPTATATPTVEVVPLGAEFAPPTNEPAGPDMPGESALEPVPVEEIAPEVELAPPAEPLGSGDPSDRLVAPPNPVINEVITIEFPSATVSSPSESSAETDQPQPVRPHPPDPELVEAAIEDAEAKSIPASPPETEDSPHTEEKP